SVRVALAHSYGPQPIDVTLSLAAGLTLHAETLVLEDSAATTHAWRAEANELTWQGVLNDQRLQDTFTAAPRFAYAGTSITQLGLAPESIQSLNCEAEPCDETLTTLALDFRFIDTHFDALTLSDNGLVAL